MFQNSSTESKTYTLLKLKRVKILRYHGNFIYKSKINKSNNKIVINTVPIGKDSIKIDVREPKVANIDDTVVYLITTLSKFVEDTM